MGHVRLDEGRRDSGTASPTKPPYEQSPLKSPKTFRHSPLLVDYLFEDGAPATDSENQAPPPALWHPGARCKAIYQGDGLLYVPLVWMTWHGREGRAGVRRIWIGGRWHVNFSAWEASRGLGTITCCYYRDGTFCCSYMFPSRNHNHYNT